VQCLGCNAASADNLRSIEAADLVVEQVFDVKQGIDLDALAFRGRRVRVPVVGAPFLWPFGGSPHPESLSRYGGYDPFRQEMGGGYLNRLLKEGLRPEEAARRYIDADVSKLVDLDRLREITMDRQRARDSATGYRCADLIEDEIAEHQLFLTPFHPTLTVSRYIACHFLRDIGAPSSAIDRIERYMTDSFYFKFGLPIHPSVSRHLQWTDAETRYRFHDEGYLTFAEFVHRYAECRASTAVQEALVAAGQQRPDAGSLLEAALVECPEAALVLFALGKLRTTEGGMPRRFRYCYVRWSTSRIWNGRTSSSPNACKRTANSMPPNVTTAPKRRCGRTARRCRRDWPIFWRADGNSTRRLP
jgi:hypothetical protein